MRALWILVAVLAVLACKDAEQKPVGARPGPGKNIVDDEVKRALVLDAAIKKLEGEIAELEAAASPDEALLAQKKDALRALRSTLANTQRHIDLARGSGQTSE